MFTGCGTAMVTPFRGDGSLDERTLRNLIQRQIDAPKRARKTDWVFVGAVLSLLFVIVCAGLWISFVVLQEALKALSQI